MKAGQVTETEVWQRCPYCGDSQHDTEKAHFSINRETGTYHCFRCQQSGLLSPMQYMQFLAGTLNMPATSPGGASKEQLPLILSSLLPGAATTRHSALDRYHTPSNEDAFLIRGSSLDITGVMLNKGSKIIYGNRGIAWPGDEELTASPDDPLIVVEGPYDVVGPRDVCTFGLPSRRSWHLLAGYNVILCPDGDVWGDMDKLNQIMALIHGQPIGPIVQGFQVLPSWADPDQIPHNRREFRSLQEVMDGFQSSTATTAEDIYSRGARRQREVVLRL
jgi:hypothetical protein